MSYSRTAYQKGTDLARGRAIETVVRGWLGAHVFDNTDSTTRLDFLIPELVVEVKAKNQQLGPRWHLLDGVDECDLFVLDELSLRKALTHFPSAYFVFADVPCDRYFWARVDEVACAERVRLNRVGPTGVAKGKLVLNLRNFRPLTNPDTFLADLYADQVSLDWKRSDCITQLELQCA